MTTKAGEMHVQAEECQGRLQPPAAGGRRKGPSLEPPEGERGHPVNTFIPGFSFLSTERINTCCFKPRPQTWSFIPATPGNPHTLPAGLIPTTHGTRQAQSRLRGGIRTHGIYLCPFLAGL